jgi:hypothetical protein
MDRRLPVIRLKRVDLPTFGRPTSTTVGSDDLRATGPSVPRQGSETGANTVQLDHHLTG